MDEVMFDLPPAAMEAVRQLGLESFPSVKIARFKAAFVEAERRGYEQAITHLQARAAELREAVDEGRATSGELSYAEMYDVCATFLSARLTEEPTP